MPGFIWTSILWQYINTIYCQRIFVIDWKSEYVSRLKRRLMFYRQSQEKSPSWVSRSLQSWLSRQQLQPQQSQPEPPKSASTSFSRWRLVQGVIRRTVGHPLEREPLPPKILQMPHIKHTSNQYLGNIPIPVYVKICRMCTLSVILCDSNRQADFCLRHREAVRCPDGYKSV